jgi:hypothetical protein
MVIVSGIGRAAPLPPAPARAAGGGFSVEVPAQRASAMPSASGVFALDGMLALQEVGAEIVRDREARRHGQALLKGLAALQHVMLAGGDQDAVLQNLANLAGSCPQAADPGLAGVVQALALRAQVELARRSL